MHLSGYYNTVTYLYRVCRKTKLNISYRIITNDIICNKHFNGITNLIRYRSEAGSNSCYANIGPRHNIIMQT